MRSDLGSPALAKVREAVMGPNGNNLDDLVRLKISISGLKIWISGLKISISGLKILISGLKISISGQISIF